MTAKIKNIIIFVAIGAVLVLIYIFFIKPAPDQGNLVSSNTVLPNVNTSGVDTSPPNGTASITQDFLTLLLNVKNIKLDDTIFSDPAFNSLHDSSITLTPDGTEGRPNPFAQFGNDSGAIVAPLNTPNVPNTPLIVPPIIPSAVPPTTTTLPKNTTPPVTPPAVPPKITPPKNVTPPIPPGAPGIPPTL
jgi:hypothetical protein